MVLFLAHVYSPSQDPESWSSKVGGCSQLPGKHARKAKTILFLFFYFYFQLDKLLTFKSRVLIFLAWLLNSGNTRLPVPREPHCTACLKCGLELQKPKQGLPCSAQTRKCLMFSSIPLLSTNPHTHSLHPSLPPPPKTSQMTHVNGLGLVANTPNASEEMWPLRVPNFALKGHRQMWAINVLALELACYPCPEYPVLRQIY